MIAKEEVTEGLVQAHFSFGDGTGIGLIFPNMMTYRQFKKTLEGWSLMIIGDEVGKHVPITYLTELIPDWNIEVKGFDHIPLASAIKLVDFHVNVVMAEQDEAADEIIDKILAEESANKSNANIE